MYRTTKSIATPIGAIADATTFVASFTLFALAEVGGWRVAMVGVCCIAMNLAGFIHGCNWYRSQLEKETP